MMATDCEDRGKVFQNDAEAVSFVAGLFDISEFRLFEMAYVHWFGSEATKKTMEGFFGRYLKTGLVPFWLRDMVRKIIYRHRKGDLTPGEFGIHRPCVAPSERRLGWVLVGLFSVLVFAIVWISARYKPVW
ncbi:MAG: hypothetical protein SWE60_20760 [Thermodesulfobacteriota bacterium]|nr:hypothetical protein [Thermodesulfobacteriota bacterium]